MSLKNALPIGYKLNGEYTIEQILGHGGFGITYFARDRSLNRPVAIKEYLPQVCALRESRSTVSPKSRNDEEQYIWGLERFKQEGQILASFNHPNIVSVLRLLDGINNTAYLVMPYEKGQSLSHYLERHGPILSEKTIKKVFLPILDGLREVHKHELLHRDIKPGNIYIRANHTPMLLDFGSARYALGEHSHSLSSVITIGYSPPEQSGSRGQGEWTDIYSVGASMYRCITGVNPVSADDRTTAILQDNPDPYVSVRIKKSAKYQHYSDALLNAVDAALQFKTKERPKTAREFQKRIMDENIGTPSLESSSERPSAAPVTKSVSNDYFIWMIVIVIVAAVLLIGKSLNMS